MIGETLTKRLAFGGPGDSLLEANPCVGLHCRGHPHTLAIEIGHDDLETLVFSANQIGNWHSDLVEIQGGSIGSPPSHLAIKRRPRKACCIGRDQQHRHSARTVAARSHRR